MAFSSDSIISVGESKNGGGTAAYGSIPVITTTMNVVDDEDENSHAFSRRVGRVTSLFVIAFTALYVLSLQQGYNPRFSTTSSSSEMELIQQEDQDVQVQVQVQVQDNEEEGVEEHSYPSSFLIDDTYDAEPLYYDEQQVDHLHVDDGRLFSQRYYKLSKSWKGPGHPILVIMGGEAELILPMLYPFVHTGLANEFGAYVISPEHRFYGQSQPVDGGYPTVQEMSDYLSPDQALEDTIQLITYIRNEIGCDPDKTHPNYCPIITVSFKRICVCVCVYVCGILYPSILFILSLALSYP
jgi:hypothetical protein